MSTVFRIRELRQAAGMTQAELARGLGYKSSSAVTMWETGDRRPASTDLPRIAELLGCTIDQLFIHSGQDKGGEGDARA